MRVPIAPNPIPLVNGEAVPFRFFTMTDYSNNQDLAHLFVNFTDLVTGGETAPEETEILVEYGDQRSEAFDGKASLLGRKRESLVWVETWQLETAGGEILGTFRCYDDRRRGWTRKGSGFGWVETDVDGQKIELTVWDKRAPKEET